MFGYDYTWEIKRSSRTYIHFYQTNKCHTLPFNKWIIEFELMPSFGNYLEKKNKTTGTIE